MLFNLAIGVFAIAGVSALPPGHGESPIPNQYTATGAQDVFAAQATAATAHPTSNKKGKAFDRFVTIWLENTDFEKAAGDPNLAWLASKGIALTNYFGVTHPSEPNYIAALSGDNYGIDNDKMIQLPANVSSVVDLLEHSNISWSTYQEDMPYTGFEGFAWRNQETKANDYVRKHNPVVIHDANTTPTRLSYQKNLTEFHKELEAKTLPQWMFITPNMTSDGHDSSVTVAGTWTRDFLEPLLANEYFMKDTLVLVTFDENHTYNKANRVFSILMGGAVDNAGLAGTTDDHFYDHYSELSTVEANWNTHTLGRWDVGANVFDIVARQTNDIYRPWDEVTGSSPSVFLNSSYAGAFVSKIGYAPIPKPNLKGKSPKTNRSVLPAIKHLWKAVEAETIYNESVEIADGQHPPAGYQGQ